MHENSEHELEGAPNPIDASDAHERETKPVVLCLPTTAAHEALTGVLERCDGFIRGTAWQLAWYDRDLRDDLEQEGRIALWRLNPVRLAAAHNPAAYRRAVIRHAMTRYLRTACRQDAGDRRVDWRVVEEVLEAIRGRRSERRRAA